MCGSGMLLIEGVLMVVDVVFGLMWYGSLLLSCWLGFDKVVWKFIQSEVCECEVVGLVVLKLVIYGSDIDLGVIQVVCENVEVVGVVYVICFICVDVVDLVVFEQEIGVVVCNLLYDECLVVDLVLYCVLGNVLQKVVLQWCVSLLCGNDELVFVIGLCVSKKYQMFNGVLECVLIVCDLIVVLGCDLVQFCELSEGVQMVVNCLCKNLKKFKSWCVCEDIICFCVYDVDLLEYVVVIDVYEEEGGRWCIFLYVQEYVVLVVILENDVCCCCNELLVVVCEVFGVLLEQVLMKLCECGKGGSKYGCFEQCDEFIVVCENNVLLQVNLFDYLDIGLFFDYCLLCWMMVEQVCGKCFLNLFCYIGVVSVQVVVVGVVSIISVDLLVIYLQWCYDNLVLNGQGGNQYLLVQVDVMVWLEGDCGQYDVIFCDLLIFFNFVCVDDFDVQCE